MAAVVCIEEGALVVLGVGRQVPVGAVDHLDARPSDVPSEKSDTPAAPAPGGCAGS